MFYLSFLLSVNNLFKIVGVQLQVLKEEREKIPILRVTPLPNLCLLGKIN